MMDEIVPRFLSHGATGEVLSRWIERSIFALSTGTGESRLGWTKQDHAAHSGSVQSSPPPSIDPTW